MSLPTKQKCDLRKQAHYLKPIVSIGNKGVTDAVLNEISIALTDHELIKLSVGVGEDKTERLGIVKSICESLEAEHIQSIGKTATIYRKSDK